LHDIRAWRVDESIRGGRSALNGFVEEGFLSVRGVWRDAGCTRGKE
jgi:hypothetical protein